MSQVPTRDQLIDAGWRKGACISNISSSPIDKYLSKAQREAVNESTIAIIVLYDCALVHGDFSGEPYFQLLIGNPVSPHSSFLNGRDPRTIHLKVRSNDGIEHYAFDASSLVQLDRLELSVLQPDLSFDIDDFDLQLLVRWFTNRFTKSSFPDEFNNRVNKKKADKFFKRFSDEVTAVLLSLSPCKEELPREEEYEARFIVLVDKQKLRSIKQKRIDGDIETAIRNLFDQDGNVKVSFVEITSEDNVTFDIMREYDNWASDYYSFRGNDASNIPIV